MQKLFIISNESIYENDNKYFCDNIDLKSTPEGLNKSFEVNLIARKSLKERAHNINVKNIKIFGSLLSFISAIISSTKNKDTKYLLISISPYTFLACIFLKLFGKTPIIYLRSDGYGEYKAILGFIGPAFYYLMFSISSSISKLISCRNYILKGRKGEVVSPSQLDSEWLSNIKETNIESLKLLYVGRIKVEKGIFSLLKLIKGKNDISLTIVGAENNMTNNINQSNVVVRQIENNKTNLINIYDESNILILPSFTESYSQVIDESLSRRRPVIIFEEIEYIIGDRIGVFVSKRNVESFSKTLEFIIKNYISIQESISKNKLPTKQKFISQMSNILKSI